MTPKQSKDYLKSPNLFDFLGTFSLGRDDKLEIVLNQELNVVDVHIGLLTFYSIVISFKVDIQ